MGGLAGSYGTKGNAKSRMKGKGNEGKIEGRRMKMKDGEG